VAEPTPDPSEDRTIQETDASRPPERPALRRSGPWRLENGIFVLIGIAALVVLAGVIWSARH
jgi:hypothetical protein